MINVATWIRECDEANFNRTFESYPQVRLWNARTGGAPWEQIAGLMLTGGSDVSGKFLRQPVPDARLIEDPDPDRDAWEFPILARALEQRLPFLGICRGLQVLNVARGGTLHLHIPNHDQPESKYGNIQDLRYAEDTPIRFPRVNSSHHQALDRLGTGLKVEAWSALDNIVEQAHLIDYPFGLAVQYHPERDALYRPLFDAFVHHLEGGPSRSL